MENKLKLVLVLLLIFSITFVNAGDISFKEGSLIGSENVQINTPIETYGYNLANATGTNRWIIRTKNPETGSNVGSDLVFNARADDGTSLANALVFTRLGKMGVGTSDPLARLHLYDTNVVATPYSATQLALEDNGEQYVEFLADAGEVGNQGFLWSDGSVGAGRLIYVHSDDSMRIYTNSAQRMRILNNGNIGIGTSTPIYPLEVRGNVSGISIWSDGNISATDYITRTSVFDKSKNVWDFVKDADYYSVDGEIEHSNFYGYAGQFEITDYSRPEKNEECKEGEICEEIIYPYTKIEEGISLNSEIDVLRQAVYELKTELCNKDDFYNFC